MTIREIGILFGFELDEKTEKEVEDSIHAIKETAADVLGSIGIGLSIKGLAEAAIDCVNLSSDVEEMENKFNVVFGHIAEETDQWAEQYADSIRRNKNEIKTYLADQQNLLTGFGATREEGAKLSKQMTTLALDLASFGNLDQDLAVNNMTKAVMGESEAAKSLGAVLNETTRAEAMLTLGLSGKYEQLDQLQKMEVNYQAIVSQSADAIGDCERSIDSYQSSLKGFQAKALEIKTMIGTFFMPTFKKIINLGTAGLIVLRDGIQKFNDFADKIGGSEQVLALFGTTLAITLAIMQAKKIGDMAARFKDLAKVLKLAAGKAMILFGIVLVLVLAMQDFMAFMRGDNSIIGAIFDKTGIGADNARNKIMQAWQSVKQFLLKNWGSLKDAARATIHSMQEWWAEHGDQVKDLMKKTWQAISNVCIVLWTILSTIAKAVFGALKAFWDAWGSQIISTFRIIWSTLVELISPFLDALTALMDFISNVFAGNWQGAWEAVKAYFAAVWRFIVTLLSGVVQVIYSIFSGVVGFFANIFSSIYQAVSEKVLSIKECIVNGFQAAIDWITSLPEKAYTWGADIIQNIVNGITGKVEAVREAVGNVAGKIKSFLGFSEPEDGPLSNFHTYMPDMMELMTKGILAGRKKLRSALHIVATEISSAIPGSDDNDDNPDDMPKPKPAPPPPHGGGIGGGGIGGGAGGLAVDRTGYVTEIVSAIRDVGDVIVNGVQKIGALANTSIVSQSTEQVAASNTSSTAVNMSVSISNEFHGDTAGQKRSSEAMDKATSDTTTELARALAYTR